jgi:hypothetical protein
VKKSPPKGGVRKGKIEHTQRRRYKRKDRTYPKTAFIKGNDRTYPKTAFIKGMIEHFVTNSPFLKLKDSSK